MTGRARGIPNAPGQHSSLEFAKRNVDYWLKRGLPASKTVLGVPFYGYGFGKAFRKSPYAYAEILAAHPEAARLDQVGETIWYNGVPTIEAKTNYAIDRKLAGIMIWSLDNDVKGKHSLLDAIAEFTDRGAPKTARTQRRSRWFSQELRADICGSPHCRAARKATDRHRLRQRRGCLGSPLRRPSLSLRLGHRDGVLCRHQGRARQAARRRPRQVSQGRGRRPSRHAP